MPGTWTDPLDGLLRVLCDEALEVCSRWHAAGRPAGVSLWAWRTLPRGALVAVRLVRDEDVIGFFEVRVARPDAPDTGEGRAAWVREVAVFQARLPLPDPPWERVAEVPPELVPAGGMAALWRERAEALR